MDQNQFPLGWDETRVREVINYYENQTEEEAVAEDEALSEDQNHTVMKISEDLVPVVRELIAKYYRYKKAHAIP